MKKRKSLKNSKKHSFKFVFKNQRLALLTIFFFTGLLVGAVSLKGMEGEFYQYIKELTEAFVLQRSSQSILQAFTYAILTDTIYIAISIIFGLCLIGEPILWILPLIRGLGTGLVSGYYYKNFALSGMLYCVVMIFIPTMLSVSATIFSCKESIITSRELMSCIRGGKSFNNKEFFKLYLLRHLILYIIMVVAALLGAALTYLFSDKITLAF